MERPRSIRVTPYRGTQNSFTSPSSEQHTVEITCRDSFRGGAKILQRFISIRMVFILVTITVLIPMAIGLIVMSINTQHDILNALTGDIQYSIEGRLTGQFASLFDKQELSTALVMFKAKPNITIPPDGTNFKDDPTWAPLMEYLWSEVRRDAIQVNVEFDFDDGRMFGLEGGFGVPGDVYLGIYANKEAVNCTLWGSDINGSIILDTNWTDPMFSYTSTWSGSWVMDDTRTYLQNCDDTYWFDLYPAYVTDIFTWAAISNYAVVCNREGDRLGYLSYSLGLERLVALLVDCLGDVQGKIFVIDSKNQLVTTSTDSRIFLPDADFTRVTTTNTDEEWIRDVVVALDSDFTERLVTIDVNRTQYLVNIHKWSHETLDWTIVQVLDAEQFLGSVHSYTKKSIIAAVLLAVFAVLTVLLVAYLATRPLFILTNELRKLSRLEFDLQHYDTPRLFETQSLFRAFGSMTVALRSFSKFVPVQVIVNILNSSKEVTLELKPREVTVMFQDIEGFTTMSEEMEPTELAKLTGECFELMAHIIVKNGGTIDKYIGDCIMSLFNVPEDLPNHAERATEAAVECLEALKIKNIEWKKRFGREINCRFGIHTGEVLVGNMGSSYRMNYTAIGDNVNIASRLESVNKLFHSSILISKAVYSQLAGGKFLTRKLAKLKVSGKQVAHAVYEVTDEKSNHKSVLYGNYEKALKAYKDKEFNQALELITQALDTSPRDKASQRLKEKILEHMSAPIDPNWSYVESLTNK